jgi:hypothetical protein
VGEVVGGGVEIRSVAELGDVVGGAPLPWVAQKARATLHPLEVRWISRSPFCT